MNGWGLAVLGWCKKGDCELGADRMYLVLHKKEKKFSIWKSPIFAVPPSVMWSWDHFDDMDMEPLNDTNTTGGNETNYTSSGDAAPAAPAPPAAAPAAAPAAGGAAADTGNSTNKTNATKKPKKKAPKKKKLPEPSSPEALAALDSDDDAEGDDLSWDIDEEEDYEGLEIKEKVNKASEMYELPGGYMHVKWLKWLKLFNDDDSD